MAGQYKQPNNVHNIARLARSSGSEVRLVINEFEDNAVVDLRRYYKKKDMEKFAPTPKGFSVPVDELPALLKAVKKAIRIAKEEELLDA